MKKVVITIIAIVGALAAAVTLLIVFRDKIKALFSNIKGKCSCNCEEDDIIDGSFEEAPAEDAPAEEAPAEEAPAEEEVPAEETPAEGSEEA